MMDSMVIRILYATAQMFLACVPARHPRPVRSALATVVLVATMTQTMVVPAAGAVEGLPVLGFDASRNEVVSTVSEGGAPAMLPSGGTATGNHLPDDPMNEVPGLSDMLAFCPPCILGVPVGKVVVTTAVSIGSALLGAVVTYFLSGGPDDNEALEDFLEDCEGDAEVTWNGDGSWEGSCTTVEDEGTGNN